MARTSQTSRRSTGSKAVILTSLHATRELPKSLGIVVHHETRGIAHAIIPRNLSLDESDPSHHQPAEPSKSTPGPAINPNREQDEDEEVSKPSNLTICKKLIAISGAPCAPMVAP